MKYKPTTVQNHPSPLHSCFLKTEPSSPSLFADIFLPIPQGKSHFLRIHINNHTSDDDPPITAGYVTGCDIAPLSLPLVPQGFWNPQRCPFGDAVKGVCMWSSDTWAIRVVGTLHPNASHAYYIKKILYVFLFSPLFQEALSQRNKKKINTKLRRDNWWAICTCRLVIFKHGRTANTNSIKITWFYIPVAQEISRS